MKIFQSKQRALPALVFFLSIYSSVVGARDLEVTRLTWAGVQLVAGDTTVFIDAVRTDLWDGNAPEGFVKPEADTRRRYALVTHAHNDHFDAEGLKKILGDRGYVICHDSIAAYIASRGLKVIPVKLFKPVQRGGFWFTAMPASDGFGDTQVNWVVSNDDAKIFHGGDTLWHGDFAAIGAVFGPFDLAFLPVNGARFAGSTGTESAAVMTPSQAIDAARLLRATQLVPIHFGADGDAGYVEVDDPIGTLEKIGARRGQDIIHAKPGDRVSIPE